MTAAQTTVRDRIASGRDTRTASIDLAERRERKRKIAAQIRRALARFRVAA